MSEKRTYVLYDGRACGDMGTSDASILCVCDSEREARSECGKWGDMAVYSYLRDGKNLTDERWEFDWHPKRRPRKPNKKKKPKPRRPWRKT